MSFYQETSVPSSRLLAVRVFSIAEMAEIQKVYRKRPFELVAPEGYEFTGEFREPKVGDLFLTDSGFRHLLEERHARFFDGARRLILRKIETKEPEQLPLPLTPKGYTAAEVLARYGQNVLDVFGYRAGSLRDYPGFVYSGELTNVNPGEWYVYAGKVMKYENMNRSVFSSLTLIPTAPPEPRIVTFTLTAPEDFEKGEAKYIQDDQGGFMTAAGAPAGAALYSRSEVE